MVPRQENESTMEYLGRTLDSVGLHDMARRARLGHFDDYFCPDEVDDGANINRLVNELKGQEAVQFTVARQQKIHEIILLAMDGEFDGTTEESEAWAKSQDGQETFRMLIEGE